MSTAVRCLFSITDNDRKKLNQDLDDQLKQINNAEVERFKQRWGFDPIKGKAVEGSGFEYTLLDRRSMPAMYTNNFRRRPTRPQSVLQARSPLRRNYVSLSSAPTKRKLQFDSDNENGSNDENQDICGNFGIPRKQAKTEGVLTGLDLGVSEVVSPAASSIVNPLSSPPTSPPSSSLHMYNSPRSPSVLSSSCPPVLESDLVNDHTCSVDVPGLSRSLSSSSLVQLSPGTQAREYVTPNVRPKPVKLVQREITDYVLIKKHASSLKAPPRS
ncbi:hypothetical protein ElyMa_004887000 [Elysia marginata]|uniref:Cyclin-dependent kinase inhibitor domain-containing protein n=1 Tax=Elysia marginata TaxID=1093978 RepID=A0AAV4IV11_9GAST|nr:hypothetical protein ElyMa_004887000 [Elysia marginata]